MLQHRNRPQLILPCMQLVPPPQGSLPVCVCSAVRCHWLYGSCMHQPGARGRGVACLIILGRLPAQNGHGSGAPGMFVQRSSVEHHELLVQKLLVYCILRHNAPVGAAMLSMAGVQCCCIVSCSSRNAESVPVNDFWNMSCLPPPVLSPALNTMPSPEHVTLMARPSKAPPHTHLHI